VARRPGQGDKVIGHAHPGDAVLGPWYRANRIELVPSLEDVIRRADLYVCDNSSSIFEFASTGRPVLVLNAPWYRPGRKLGLRFWDAAGVGIQVDRGLRARGSAIARALEDPPELRARREADAQRVVYQPRRGGAKLAAGAPRVGPGLGRKPAPCITAPRETSSLGAE
jgi:hypothetical protein